MATLVLRPNAAGDETAIPSQEPTSGAHWDKVDEATPDNDTTFVYNLTTSYLRDLYNIPDHTTEAGTINSVKIYFRCGSGGANSYAKPSLKSDSTVTDGTEVNIAAGTYTTYSQTWTTNPADSGVWAWADIDALQIGVSLKGATSTAGQCTQVYVEVDYTSPQTYECSCSDGLKLGDSSVIGLVYNLLVSEGIKLGDTSLADYIFNVLASEGIKLGDSPTTQAVLNATASDGLKVGDTPSTLAELQALASDGLKLGDSPLANAVLYLTLVDGFKLSDAIALICSFNVTASDGLKLGDTAFRDWMGDIIRLILRAHSSALTLQRHTASLTLHPHKGSLTLQPHREEVSLKPQADDLTLQKE